MEKNDTGKSMGTALLGLGWYIDAPSPVKKIYI